jgi:hypothetical protein
MTTELTFMTEFCVYCKKEGHWFRESGKTEETALIICPVLLSTKCGRCGELGHTTTRCVSTYQDEEKCAYCHRDGHIKKYCPVLGEVTCRFCKEKGHSEKRCFKKMHALK